MSMSFDDSITIVEYSPIWCQRAVLEIQKIKEKLSTVCVQQIEHVGSTSVPGLAAKPIIDIAIEVKQMSDGLSAIKPLESLDYIFWDDNPDKTHMFFVKGLPPKGQQRTHHIHIFKSQRFDEYSQFRDKLRKDTMLLKNYQDLKWNLAKKFKHDREGYTKAKTLFVMEALKATQ